MAEFLIKKEDGDNSTIPKYQKYELADKSVIKNLLNSKDVQPLLDRIRETLVTLNEQTKYYYDSLVKITGENAKIRKENEQLKTNQSQEAIDEENERLTKELDETKSKLEEANREIYDFKASIETDNIENGRKIQEIKALKEYINNAKTAMQTANINTETFKTMDTSEDAKLKWEKDKSIIRERDEIGDLKRIMKVLEDNIYGLPLFNDAKKYEDEDPLIRQTFILIDEFQRMYKERDEISELKQFIDIMKKDMVNIAACVLDDRTYTQDVNIVKEVEILKRRFNELVNEVKQKNEIINDLRHKKNSVNKTELQINTIKDTDKIKNIPFKNVLASEAKMDDKSQTDTRRKELIKTDTTLPIFNGKSDMNIDEWLYQCNKLMTRLGYSDGEKVDVITYYLRGMALQDYLVFERIKGNTPNWDEFEEYMRTKYTPQNHTQIIRDKIVELKQLTSIREFYLDFRRLALQAPKITEDEQMSWFIKNMKPGISQHVLLQKPKSLEDAYQAALLYETYCTKMDKNIFYTKEIPKMDFRNQGQQRNINPSQDNQKQHSINTNQNQVYSNNKSSNQEDNHYRPNQQRSTYQQNNKNMGPQNNQNYQQRFLQNQLQNPLNMTHNINSQLNQGSRSELVCSICFRRGHTAEMCFAKTPRKHCGFCDKPGHLEQECWKKAYFKNKTNDRNMNQVYSIEINKENKIPSWRVYINGQVVKAALDSCAETSVISLKTVKRLKLDLIPDGCSILSANGESSRALGKTHALQIQLKDLEATIQFTITNLKNFDIILGLDFFEQTGILLDPKNRAFIEPGTPKGTNFEDDIEIKDELNIMFTVMPD